MKYRKYFEPEYGEPDKYVKKEKDFGAPEGMSRKAFRVKSNFETLTNMTEMMKDIYCYDELMKIETDDYRVRRDGWDVTLRVYHPMTEGPHPIMLFYHGGGWTMNNLDLYDYVPRYFTRYGDIVVVAVDYRLAPEHPFPAGVEDCVRSRAAWKTATWDSSGPWNTLRRSAAPRRASRSAATPRAAT